MHLKLYVHTVRIYGEGDYKKKVSLLATNKLAATIRCREYYDDIDRKSFVPSLPTCQGRPMTEVHCLKYGTKFQTVHKGSVSRSFECDEYAIKSPVLTKCEYNPINRSYLCIDGEGNKHYVDAYEWCITEEEK